MIGRTSEHRLQPVGFGEQHRDVVVCPVEGGQVLQEHHQALEVPLALQLAREAQQEGDGDVEVEMREAILFGEIGVPQADDAAQGQFPHQQVVHPAEGELQVLHLVAGQVVVQLAVEAFDEFLHGEHVLLDARLRERVVVLDGVQEARNTPEAVSLHARERFFGRLRLVHREFSGNIEICVEKGEKIFFEEQ